MLKRWKIVAQIHRQFIAYAPFKDIFSLYKAAGFVKILILDCATAQKRKQPVLANPSQDQDNRSTVQYGMASDGSLDPLYLDEISDLLLH